MFRLQHFLPGLRLGLLCVFLLSFARAAPVITSSPVSRLVVETGQAFTLTVGAVDDGDLSYQWRKDNRELPGETGPTLTRASVSRADAGVYVAEITDTLGAITRTISHVLLATPSPRAGGWGDAAYGQLDVPASVIDLVSIAAGGSGSFGLKKDGTVVEWGNAAYDQIPLPTALTDPATANIAAISEGYLHKLALRADGTVIRWGSSFDPPAAPVPSDLSSVIAISAGYDHSLALKADGIVVAWRETNPYGSNYGQAVVPSGLEQVVAISAGYQHSLALKADGTVVAWGDNTFGRSTVPSGLGNVIAIAAGASFSLALKADGTVVAWGFYHDVPAGLADVVSIAAGGGALALKADGSVVAWGDLAAPPAGATRITAIAAGTRHALALRDASLDTAPMIVADPASRTILAGSTTTFTVGITSASGLCAYQWYKNGTAVPMAKNPSLVAGAGQTASVATYSVRVTNSLGTATSADAVLTVIPPPTLVSTPPARQLLTLGQPLELAVSATGTGPLSYRWKHNGRVVDAVTGPTLTRDPATSNDAGHYVVEVTDANGLVARAFAHVLLPVAGTKLVGWGANNYGQRGDGLAFSPDLVAVSAGGNHALALKADGTVSAWGDRSQGQLNLYTSDAVAIAAGYNFSLALKADGTLVAAGRNYQGNMVVPSTATGIIDIAAGRDHALAIKADGTVLQVGPTLGSLPSGLTGVVAVAAGDYDSLVLLADGRVVASSNLSVPQTLRDVVAIAMGGSHAVALESDGTVVCWGSNTHGQSTPPAGLRNVVAIRASGNFTLALTADGTVVAWGDSGSGQTATPPLLQNVRLFTAGGAFSLAVRDSSRDGAPAVTVPVSPVYITAGTSARVGVEATGGELGFAWSKNEAPYPQASGPSLSFGAAQISDSGVYRLIATNSFGSVTSDPVTVEVVPPPAVAFSVPVRHVLAPGQALNIEATMTGHGALTRRWTKNGRPLGADGASYIIPSVTTFDGGRYELEVVDSHGGGIGRAFVWVYVVPEQQQVVVWGAHPSTVPSDLGRVITVAGGYNYTMALRADGTVTAWGPATGIAPPPAAAHDVVAIAAGTTHMMALRADGTVISWNINGSGQRYVPAGLTDVISLSAGYHSFALKRDGTVVGWLGSHPVTTNTLKNIIAISGDIDRLLALRADGTVASIQFSLAGWNPFSDWNGITAIAGSSYALRSDGAVLGPTGTTPNAALGLVSEISAYGAHILARAADGAIRISGPANSPNADLPPGLSSAALISAGFNYSVAVRDASADILPSFVSTPASATTIPDQAVTFTAAASNAIYYRWYRNGAEIVGISGPQLTLTANAAAQEGTYEVRAVSGAGEAISAPFSLGFAERFETWRLRGFTTAELADAAISAPLAVLGPDTAPNLLKYALGIQPHEPIGASAGAVVHDGAGWSFVYERPADRPDLAYEVQTSADLANWHPADRHVRVEIGTDGTETWMGQANEQAPRLFFRLNVVRPAMH